MSTRPQSPYQLLPALTGDEYAALRDSIRRHGVQVPVLVDEHGHVIDGHHRKAIAAELGVPCPTRTVGEDASDQDKRTLALTLNLDRRHLNREQRRTVIAASLQADPDLSDRQHATRTGASPTTVGAVRGDLEETGRLSKLDSRRSADGVNRPSAPRRRADPTPPAPEPEPPVATPAEETAPAAPGPVNEPSPGSAGGLARPRGPMAGDEPGRGEDGPGGGPRPGRRPSSSEPPPASVLVRALVRAVAGLAAAPVPDLEQLDTKHRREARAAHEQLAAVLDRIDPQTDPDLDAAAADIAARTHVDEDEARWIARAVRDRNKPGNLAGYVRRIEPADLLARYRPDRKHSAAAMPPCEHGISGGLRVIGRGDDASRHCPKCEQADPAVQEPAS